MLNLTAGYWSTKLSLVISGSVRLTGFKLFKWQIKKNEKTANVTHLRNADFDNASCSSEFHRKDASRNLRGSIMLWQHLKHRYKIRWEFGESLFQGVCLKSLSSCGQELLNTALIQTVCGKCQCMSIASVITVTSYRGIEVKNNNNNNNNKT